MAPAASWTDTDREESELAVSGRYLETGAKQRAHRVPVSEEDVER